MSEDDGTDHVRAIALGALAAARGLGLEEGLAEHGPAGRREEWGVAFAAGHIQAGRELRPAGEDAAEVLDLIGEDQATMLARIWWDLDELAAQPEAPPGVRGVAAELLGVYQLSATDLPDLRPVCWCGVPVHEHTEADHAAIEAEGPELPDICRDLGAVVRAAARAVEQHGWPRPHVGDGVEALVEILQVDAGLVRDVVAHIEAECRELNDRGEETWATILGEELAEVLAEDRDVQRRRELHQLAAVCILWAVATRARDDERA